MNFKPEKIYLGKGSNGKKIRIEEWNYNTRAGVELASGFINIFSLVFLTELMSPFMALITILSFNGKQNVLNLVGLGVGSYFLIDAYNGWLVTSFLRILLSENVMNWLVYLNAISILIHAFLIVFGSILFNLIISVCSTYEKCEQFLYVVITFLVVIGWLITHSILVENPGWLDKNVKANVEKNREPEPVDKPEEKPKYNDGYFHDDPNYEKELEEMDEGKPWSK